MRGDLHLVMVLAGLCAGCAYDSSGGYSQPNQLYGYSPGYMQPGAYAPSYPPYVYEPYGSPPQYYQPAPSLGLGFGVFGSGGHREHEREEEWREHHDRGERPRGSERGEGHRSGFNPAAAVNVPPAATHMPPPAFRPASPPVAQRLPPPAAANARNLHP
jgi:hypothetical protein